MGAGGCAMPAAVVGSEGFMTGWWDGFLGIVALMLLASHPQYCHALPEVAFHPSTGPRPVPLGSCGWQGRLPGVSTVRVWIELV